MSKPSRIVQTRKWRDQLPTEVTTHLSSPSATTVAYLGGTDGSTSPSRRGHEYPPG